MTHLTENLQYRISETKQDRTKIIINDALSIAAKISDLG